MFDPPSIVKYAQTPSSVLESPAHRTHALKMAHQSMVLLKNDNNTLPLSKKLKKIAILGPNADNAIAVLGNYNGIPSEIVTALQGIKNKVGNNTKIVYEQAVNFTNDTLLDYTDISSQYSWDGKQGFKAEYFNNRELKGEPAVIRIEEKLDHFWQDGQAVVGAVRANNFSARYTTNFTASRDGNITFEIEADDGYKLIMNDRQVINAWTRNRWGARTYRLQTKKDSVYKIVIEYWQGEGKANVRLRAGNLVKTDFNALAGRVKDADAIIFLGGISPQLEGEEMTVDYPGFNGGDRTSILLPMVQTQLLKTLKTTGKPVIFVMMTGSAIALPWESENLPAILNAWYGGQSAGTAIADILFGDYNPAGRLPITFYKSDQDLPDFNDYSMENRTYRYFKGEALYPFGYGLSYTTFKYDQLKTPNTAKAGNNIQVSVRVSNTGKIDGEEVVQLYITNENKNIRSALKSLKGFKRIFLRAGENRIVHFELRPHDLSVADENGTYQPLRGNVSISVGGGQPGEKVKGTFNPVQSRVTIN
jgi:beta-glucosidase